MNFDTFYQSDEETWPDNFWHLRKFLTTLTILEIFDNIWWLWRFLTILTMSENFGNFWHLWKSLTYWEYKKLWWSLGAQFMRNPVVAKKVLVVQCGDRALLWRFCGCAQPYRGSLSQGTPRLIRRLPVLSQLFDGKKNLISTGSVWPLPPMPYPLDQRILTQAFE